MKKILSLALLVALFGIAFAGTIVNVGETTPIGGTTTTTTTTTEDVPPQETQGEGSTGGLGGLTMENSEGDTINVGGAEGAITPLGSGEESGTSGSASSSESGSTTFPDGGTGSSSTSSANSETSPVETSCTLGFALLACAIAAFTNRK